MDLYTIEQLALWKHSEWKRKVEAERQRKELQAHPQPETHLVQSPRFKQQLGLTLIRAGEWLVKTT